eukprot:746463-Hanusia_phi.AAC.4
MLFFAAVQLSVTEELCALLGDAREVDLSGPSAISLGAFLTSLQGVVQDPYSEFMVEERPNRSQDSLRLAGRTLQGCPAHQQEQVGLDAFVVVGYLDSQHG